jgi:glycerol-3-phosphate dehydrogenase subunit B
VIEQRALERRVIVVGSGVAGTGAAIAAARAGAHVTMIDGGTGASTLATGALDFEPWDQARSTRTEISREARAVLDALGAYVVREDDARLVTSAGVVRPARGRDAALIDVAPLEGRRVGVVRCHRPGWDADALAMHWGSAFVAIDAQVLRHTDERVIPDADFAARHDDEARVHWLADRLRDALSKSAEGGSLAGLVLPSSLGVERSCAGALSERTGISCGEATTLPGGPSGLRFERARDRALAAAGVRRVAARVTSVARDAAHGSRHDPSDASWLVSVDSGQTCESHSVVFATGGLLGGGIEYAPSESDPASAPRARSGAILRVTVGAPLTLGAFGRALEAPGSMFGVAPEAIAWPFVLDGWLEHAGVLVVDNGACLEAPPGLYAAGELVSDAPRTWLHALTTGARAGAAAALLSEFRFSDAAPSPAQGPASPP